MAEIGNIFVRISASIDEFEKNMRKVKQNLEDLEKRYEGIRTVGARLADVGKSLMIGVTAPFTLASGVATKFAMDAIETENLFRVAMGNMAKAAEDWANRLSDALGLNKYELMKNVGMYYQMFTAMGLGEKNAYKMATSLTQLAYDMASFYNLDVADAFEKLTAGIMGEIEPLRRLGILVDDMTIQQLALRKGIAKEGQELTQQQKVLLRYMAILEQTKNAQGDLARTIESPTNQLRILKSRLQELAVTLGKIFIPAVTAVTKALNSLIAWFQNLDPAWQKFFVGLGSIIALIGPVVLALGKLMEAIVLIRQGLSLLGKGFSALKTLFAALPPQGKVIVAVIGGLVVAGTLLYKNWDKVRYYGLQAWGALKVGILTAACGIVTAFKFVLGWIPILGNAFSNMQKALAGYIAKEKQIMAQRSAAFSDNSYIKAAQQLVANQNQVAQAAQDAAQGLNEQADATKKAAKEANDNIQSFDEVHQIMQDTADASKDVANNIEMPELNDLGNIDLGGGLSTGIGDMFSGIADKISSFWDTIKSKAETVWNSLSTFFSNTWNSIKSIAETIWDSIANFFMSVWQRIYAAAPQFWDALGNYLRTLWQGWVSIAQSIWNAIVTIFQSTWQTIYTVAVNIWNMISAFLKGDWEGVRQAAVNIWNAILNHITTVWNAIRNVIATVWQAIANNLTAWWQLFLGTTQTVWNGIKLVFDTVWNGIKTTITTVWTGIQTFLVTSWTTFTTTVQTVWNAIKNIFLTVWNLIKSIITTTWQAIVAFLTTAWEAFKATTLTVWNAIKNVFLTIWNMIKGIFTTTWNAIATFLNTAWDNLKNTANTVWDAIKNFIVNPIQSAKNTLTALWNDIGKFISTAWNNIKQGFVNSFNAMYNAIIRPFEEAWNYISSIFNRAYEWGRNLVSNITAGIQSAISSIGNAAKGAADKIADFLGFHSPAREGPGKYADEWMPNLMDMLAQGIYTNINKVRNAALTAATTLQDIITAQPTLSFATTPTSYSNAPTSYSPAITPKTEIHLHVGTLIADDLGLKKLEQKLRQFRILEEQRIGSENR